MTVVRRASPSLPSSRPLSRRWTVLTAIAATIATILGLSFISFSSTPVQTVQTTLPESESVTMGFTKQILKAGNGLKPTKGQAVTVHCTGYGKNRDMASKFWSTKDPGQEPFTFKVGLGQVIKGWDESVIDMSIGEVAKIHCSPDYAYGAGGFPAWGIQPNSELIFEIEVLSYK